ARRAALEEAERALASAQAGLAHVTASFNDTSVTAGGQRVELTALRAQADALKGQVESYEKETKALWEHLNSKTAELETSGRQLAEERGRADDLANRVAELDHQLIAQAAESEALGARVQELAARLDEQAPLLADREYHSESLRNAAMAAQKIEAELRAQLAEAQDRQRVAMETLRTEKSLIENELKRSQEERDKLQREIAAARRDGENVGAYERMENAVLRERIDEVAAEVARLTATLEGPDSPIEGILNSGRPAAAGGNGPSIASPAGSKGTLADRIRTLQARAARAASTPREARRGSAPRGARADKGGNGLATSMSSLGSARGRTQTRADERLAQRESVPFTRERPQVRSLQRPPIFKHLPAVFGSSRQNVTQTRRRNPWRARGIRSPYVLQATGC